MMELREGPRGGRCSDSEVDSYLSPWQLPMPRLVILAVRFLLMRFGILLCSS